MKNKLKLLLPIIAVVSFGIIAGLSLIHKGLPPTHDGEYHVIRFYEFDKTLKGGDWYPRWASDLNNGYGVPLFNYVYPLPNYASFVLHLFGVSFIDAFKLSMFFATIIGSAFFYLWTKQFWGNLGGIVSSVFYTFSPYHFVDIYIRGSVGEVWALAFFPAFLWSITKFIKYRQKIFFILSSIFFALIIFSHNIVALMFSPFAITYIIFLIYQERDKKYLISNTFYIILLGLGISAIFWFPALLESRYVRGLQIFDIFAHFPDLYQLIVPSWGSGFSGESSLQNGLSFQIGAANLFVVFLSLLLILSRHSGLSRISHRVWRFWSPLRQMADRSQNDGNVNVIIFFLVWFSLVFFLMLKISLPIWQIVPFMTYFQFPWRLLSLEILVASFLSGSIVYFWRSKIVATCFVLITFFLGIGYAKPAYYLYRDDNYYITRSNFIDGTNSPGNVFNTIFFNTDLKKQKEKLSFIKGGGGVNQIVDKSTLHVFDVKTDKDSEIEVNIAYFPGWIVKLDGEQISTKKTSSGLFSFYVSKGKHVVEVRFTNTPIRNIAILLSSISFTIVSILFIKLLFATIRR